MILIKKIWPGAFEEILIGAKPFDVREERDFPAMAGDVVRLREWDPSKEAYSGRCMDIQITYQVRTSEFPEEYNVPGGVAINAFRVLRNWVEDKEGAGR